MEIKNFLELSVGKWFSQRTSYHLVEQTAENSKSEITIEWLPQNNPEVVQLCQQYQIHPTAVLGGTKACWDNSVDSGKPKQIGSALIVFVPEPDQPHGGKLLRAASSPQTSLVPGRYSLGNDEALTLMIEDRKTYSEERLWFASPNLRLRTSLIQYAGGFGATTFYSEIRKVPPKPTNP